jgi:glycosyltransferase involved in cell wall biosynthesis
VAALPAVISEIPDAYLTLLGSFRTAGFESQLKRFISENKLYDQVHVNDQIPHESIWAILNNHAVGIIPFRDNPLTKHNTPTKLFEMMAAGCRIVASDLPPIRNFVPATVHWSTPGDISSIAGNIIEAFHSLNQSSWIEENRNLVREKYNWELIRHRLITLYEQLLN